MQKKNELLSRQQELQKAKEAMQTRKSELLELKKIGGKSWSEALQDELDELVSSEVDLYEQIEINSKQLAELSTESKKSDYEVPKGTENLVHLSIVRGRRFNPNTGKDESKPYVQMFSISEFNLFKDNANLLGYSVLKVLHDPTGEAEKLISKK